MLTVFTVCFKVFDKDMDGKLNENELKSMAMSLLEVKQMSSNNTIVTMKQNQIAGPNDVHTQGHSSNFTKTAESPVPFTGSEPGVKRVAESQFFTSNSTSEQAKTKRASQKIEYSSKEATQNYNEIMDEKVTVVVSSALQYAVDKVLLTVFLTNPVL